MGFLVSPGVEVNEIDLTNVIPAVSTSIGGYAGNFRWGPIEQIVQIGSEKGLLNIFGKPDAATAKSFLTAASFLKYGEELRVVRCTDGSLKNAVDGGSSGRISGFTLNSSLSSTVTGLTAEGNITVVDVASSAGDAGVGTGAVLQGVYGIDSVSLSTSSSGGSGYEVNDIIYINLGGGEIAAVRIDSVGTDGVVDFSTSSDYTILDTGTVTDITAVNSISVIDTNGDGTGLIVDVTYKLVDINVLSAGSGYEAADTTPYFNGVDISADITAITVTSGSNTPTLIKNEDHFELLSGLDSAGSIFARYAGALGNEIRVAVIDSTNWDSSVYSDEFDGAPSGVSGEEEVHILVLDKNGVISGTGSETILERYPFLSKVAGTKSEDGTALYYVDRINRGSNWIYFANTVTKGVYNLSGGVDGAATPVDGNVITALDLLADAETVDVNLLFSLNTDNIDDKLLSIASQRKDVVVFLSPPQSATVNNTFPLPDVMAWANAIESSNYAVLDSSALYVYDKYNDAYRWIPACGHMAGLCAKTDDLAEPWFSPAGLNRGQLLGVTKLAFNPRQDQRDTLYKGRVNPIVSFPGEGIVLFGDKTAQSKPSAFDRINVRRLFIVLEKAIATAAKYQLFELNDEFTRAMFRNMTEPFLRDVKGRRGVYDFLVVCDETNNTPEIIDTNRFVADIYIKPARSINFITLNFIATRTGVEFSEIVGL